MSKLADQLRAIRLFNNYDLLRRFGSSGDVAIEYSPSERWNVNRTTVWSPHSHPKLEASKQDRNWEKTFIGKRAETFWLARNWAAQEFGHDYEPSPFGGHIPSHIRHKAKTAAKANPTPDEKGSLP